MFGREFLHWLFICVAMALWACTVSNEARAVIPAQPTWSSGTSSNCALYGTGLADIGAAWAASPAAHPNCTGGNQWAAGATVFSGSPPSQSWRREIKGWSGSACIASGTYRYACQQGAGSLSCASVPNSTKVGSNCVCNEGYEEEGGACVEPQCVSGVAASGWFDMGTTPLDPPSSVCTPGGCIAIYSGASVQARALVDGTYHYYANGQYNTLGGAENECSDGNALPTGAPGGVPADACDDGQTMGQVNGRNVCVDNTTGNPVNPNATPAERTTTTTQTPATPPDGENPADQSGDGTTVTQNPDGSTTTRTVSTDPGTGVRTITETTTEPDPQDSYCDEHPDAPICEEEGESAFGGSCPSFTCEGDAVQCAIAREQHQRNCELFETETDLSNLGEAAVAGTDTGTTENPADEGNREEVALPGVLDQTRWLSSTCPADISFTLVGQSVSLPLAALCDVLEIVGNLAVAVALVAAVFIVGVF